MVLTSNPNASGLNLRIEATCKSRLVTQIVAPLPRLEGGTGGFVHDA